MASQERISTISRATLRGLVLPAVISAILFTNAPVAPAAPIAPAAPTTAAKPKLIPFDFPTRADLGVAEVFHDYIDASGKPCVKHDHVILRGHVAMLENSRVVLILSYYGLENLQALTPLAHTPGIKVIEVSAAKLEMDDKQAEFLKIFPYVNRANFDGALITDKALAIIGGWKYMADLRLSSTDVKGTGFGQLDNKPLQILNIAGISLLPGSLGLIKSLPKTLIEINCSKVRLKPVDFATICQCPRLIAIDITGNADIDDRLATGLVNLRQLVSLKISDTKITDKSLPMLAKLPALKQLIVREKTFWHLGRGKSPRPDLQIIDSGGSGRTPAELFEPLH